jgi:hypothetical protein
VEQVSQISGIFAGIGDGQQHGLIIARRLSPFL